MGYLPDDKNGEKMDIHKIISTIWLIGIPIAYAYFWFKTDVGGWSEGGCMHSHNLTSLFFSLIWPILLIFAGTIYLIELTFPGFLPGSDKELRELKGEKKND